LGPFSGIVDFARILADAVARQGAPTPFADAVAAFEQGILRAALHVAREAPVWARVLHVAPDCSERELRAAFRRRAFETHPDRPGGSEIAFLEAQRALAAGLAALAAPRQAFADAHAYPR
jgi:hypothetical protein